MKKELISVIVPVYNVELYLKQCIESIIHQTYENIEILLINDGSTDQSGEICDQYALMDKRIKVIHKKNAGLSSARNVGIQSSRGKYIQFIDSDDYIVEDAIQTIYETMLKYNADVVSFSHYILKENEIICNSSYEEKEFTTIQAIQELLLDKQIRNYSWEKMWKIELFQEIQFPEGKQFEDIATTALLFERAKKIVLYDYPKYYYRQRKGSILHEPSEELSKQYINTTIQIYEHIKEKYPELKDYCEYSIMNALIRTYNDIALYGFENLHHNDTMKQLYENAKKNVNMIESNSTIIKEMPLVFKIHMYFLLYNQQKYIENHSCLPKLCDEQG